MRVPQAAGIRRSVEVKHGTRGVARMLRRGLHGSKNWVLELDESGEHRSPWAKLFRALVVLAPVWIVASAMTGGPERGGHSVGTFQSVVGALLVLLVGLAVFSARERRLGREEPWQDFEQDDDSDTESDDDEKKTLVDPSPEEETRVIENAQVADSGSSETGEIEEGDSVFSTETAQIERPDLQSLPHQATGLEPETVVIAAPEAPTAVLPTAVQQATSSGANGAESDRSFDAIVSAVEEFRQKDVQQATPEPAYSLVKGNVEPVRPDLHQTTSGWTSLDVSTSTESDDGAIGDQPTTPLRPTVQQELHAEAPAMESPQVNLLKEDVQQPLQGVLQVQFAPSGPYPMEDEPVHEDWWIVAPDIESGPEGETAVDAPVETPVGPEPDETAPALVPAEPVRQEAAERAAGRHHPIVLAYFASQAPKSSFTTEEKDQARSEMIAWLREEISAEHLNRAEASRMLGVDPSTITRWLSDDPWAG